MGKGPSPGPLHFGGWEDEQEPAQETEEGGQAREGDPEGGTAQRLNAGNVPRG